MHTDLFLAIHSIMGCAFFAACPTHPWRLQAWMRGDDEDLLGGADDGPDLEEDAAFEEQAEAYEYHYNFRYEVRESVCRVVGKKGGMYGSSVLLLSVLLLSVLLLTACSDRPYY